MNYTNTFNKPVQFSPFSGGTRANSNAIANRTLEDAALAPNCIARRRNAGGCFDNSVEYKRLASSGNDPSETRAMFYSRLVTGGRISQGPLSTVFNSISTGFLTVSFDATVNGSIYVGDLTTLMGNVLIGSTDASVDVNTGALVVAGGVGVIGNLNVGGATTLAGTLFVEGV
jgi:hypothetical protein